MPMQTPLQITFKNLPTSEALEARLRERAERLERFHDNIIGCRIVVETPHRAPDSGKLPIGIALEVEVPGKMLVSKGEEEVRESKNDSGRVVSQVFNAMERQLEDYSRSTHRKEKQPVSAIESGRIARLFPEQKYGFVEIGDGPDLYFTENVLQGLTMSELEVGMMVAITRAGDEGPMGPNANSVRKLGEDDRQPR